MRKKETHHLSLSLFYYAMTILKSRRRRRRHHRKKNVTTKRRNPTSDGSSQRTHGGSRSRGSIAPSWYKNKKTKKIV